MAEEQPSPPTPLRLRHPAALIATCGGIGLLPWAPGTWGSLAALPVAWLIHQSFGAAALLAATLIAFLAGWWAAGVYITAADDKDPSAVVVDEVAGSWLVLATVPREALAYAAAFALFRLFDITKPWPVRWADRELSSGLGVMLDDVLAAVYAAFALYLLLWLIAATGLGGA